MSTGKLLDRRRAQANRAPDRLQNKAKKKALHKKVITEEWPSLEKVMPPLSYWGALFRPESLSHHANTSACSTTARWVRSVQAGTSCAEVLRHLHGGRYHLGHSEHEMEWRCSLADHNQDGHISKSELLSLVT